MGLAEELFAQWQAQKKVADELGLAPEITQYNEAVKALGNFEAKFKEVMKEENSEPAKLGLGKFEAVLTIRKGSPTIVYDIPAIEKEPWGAGCVIKAVDTKTFDAIIKGKSLDAAPYRTETPGNVTKAVSIKELAEGYSY